MNEKDETLTVTAEETAGIAEETSDIAELAALLDAPPAPLPCTD